MASPWWLWPAGALLVFAAGVLAVALPRWRMRGVRRDTAWSAAQAAIATASISRDAAGPVHVAEAEELLSRAEALAAHHGGPAAAGQAARCAEQADELWRAAARD